MDGVLGKNISSDKSDEMYSSLSVKSGREESFLKTIEGLIVAVVFRYASLGGMYEQNVSILSDMKQEARLAVLEEHRKRGSKYEPDLGIYRGIIKNACLKTVADSRVVRVPEYWLTRSGREKRNKEGGRPLGDYQCQSVEAILEQDNIEVLGIDSFEDWLVLRIVVEDLFVKAKKEERKVLTLLGSGFTVLEISKILHCNRRLVYYAIDKLKKLLKDGGVVDGTWGRKPKGYQKRRIGTVGVVGTV